MAWGGAWSFSASPMWVPELASPTPAPWAGRPAGVVSLPHEMTLDLSHLDSDLPAAQDCPAAGSDEVAPMQLDSTLKKRRKKMKKHQLKVRRKRDRAKNRDK